MNFHEKREQSRLKRQPDILSLKDKKKATRGFQIMSDAEFKIECASNTKEVKAIINSTREALRGIYGPGEEHDHSRFQSLLVDLFEDGVEWVKSKDSD